MALYQLLGRKCSLFQLKPGHYRTEDYAQIKGLIGKNIIIWPNATGNQGRFPEKGRKE